MARASGILGLSAVLLLMLLPVCYLLAAVSHSELSILLCFGMILIMLVCGVLGIALGFHARKGGAWALVGIVTSILAVLFSLCTFTVVIFQL